MKTYTAQMIEDELYSMVRGFCLPISGGVYKRATRPYNSKEEDCVVAFLTGGAKQVQEGTVLINIYVPDIIAGDGQAYKNTTRCAEIEKSLVGFDTLLNTKSDIYFKTEDMIKTIEEEDINQHFVSLKLRFKVLTN